MSTKLAFLALEQLKIPKYKNTNDVPTHYSINMKHTDTMNPEEAVDVTLHEPDLNDPSWKTLAILFDLPDKDHPGTDEEISGKFRLLVSRRSLIERGLGNAYANPHGVIRCTTLNENFLSEARQLQKKWFSQFNSGLSSAGRVKRATNEMSPIIRQLAFTGVMVCNGRHVPPNCWPDVKAKHRQPNSRKRR